jgi:hypothetical protein
MESSKVVSIIFLDIAAAFPDAVTERLMKDIGKLGLQKEYSVFYNAMLANRKTRLLFGNYTFEYIPIENG